MFSPPISKLKLTKPAILVINFKNKIENKLK